MCNQCNFNHSHIFKSNYQLVGRDWLKLLSDEDRQVFIDLGMRHNEHGRLGGIARAKNGKRDSKGRFIADARKIAITVARMNVRNASPGNREWAIKRLAEEIKK